MNVEELEESRNYLSRVAVWPRHVDVVGWLSNFDAGPDRVLAMCLLDALVHINEEHIAHAVASTIREISSRPEFGNSEVRPNQWASYVPDSGVTRFV